MKTCQLILSPSSLLVGRVESEEGHVVPVSEATTTSPLINPPPPFTAMNVRQQINPLPSPMENGSHDQTPESHDVSMTESNEQSREEMIQPLGVDPEMVRLETQLDVWCLDLKRNVLVCIIINAMHVL